MSNSYNKINQGNKAKTDKSETDNVWHEVKTTDHKGNYERKFIYIDHKGETIRLKPVSSPNRPIYSSRCCWIC